MHLLAAVLGSALKSVLVVAGLMGVLFVGYLLVAEAGPTVREVLETPGRLEELELAGQRNVEEIGRRRGEETAQRARQHALELRLRREREVRQERLEEELQEMERAAQEQMERVGRTMEEHRQRVGESIRRAEAEACQTWNPLEWWACRAVRQRLREWEQEGRRQRELVRQTGERLAERARQDMDARGEEVMRRLEEDTAGLREELEESLRRMEDVERERQALEEQLRGFQAEEALLREANWLWIAFKRQWRGLLLVALLIFVAPYVRRTAWYFVGMPLVSRAKPIRLEEREGGEIEWGEGARLLKVEVEEGERILARPGYIHSERSGATSEIFFDKRSPNLSYMSGLVLLTRLEGGKEGGREVVLGTPDDPDAYLMRIELKDHPGVVLRTSHVVAVMGDVRVRSMWRLRNLHAWATSQVRFLVFSGTGTLILEGQGDVSGRRVEGREEKRMPVVLGFDTRLVYQTRRTATFLPYLVDPGREPLVVDTFEGEGAVFFEKNPTDRMRKRSVGEAVAGFFLDAIRRLLGL